MVVVAGSGVMFKLKSPCANCPFRRGVGETFGLEQIREAPATDPSSALA